MKKDRPKNQRILLISRDLSKDDFYVPLPRILELAVSLKAETLLFALFTLDYKHILKDKFRASLLSYSHKFQKLVILEFTDMETKTGNMVVTFDKGRMNVFYQWFGRASDGAFWKEALIAELPERIFSDGSLLLICGELSLGLKVDENSKRVHDPYNFFGWLKMNRIKVILNPFHDTAVRWEIAQKRKAISREDRLLVSVWNRNPKRFHNSICPFQIFYDGQDISEAVSKIEKPTFRCDIKVGLLDLKNLQKNI